MALAAFFAAFGALGYMEYAAKGGGAAETVSTGAGSLPKDIEGIPLVNVVNGKAALDQISELHGTNIKMVSGYIATYEKEQERTIVWVARAKNAADAQALLEAMLSKMANNKVFAPPQKLVIKDRAYFYTVGAGMSNYFYVKNDAVYWIGAITPNEVNVVKAIIREM